MRAASKHRTLFRALAGTAAVAAGLLGSNLTASSSGDLQGQIAAGRSAAASLRQTVATDEAQIRQTAGGVQAAELRLTALQSELTRREDQLRAVQTALLAARNHLAELENRLQVASKALSANLVAAYEGNQPDLITVVLNARGFTDLLEQVNFLQRIGHQDATIVAATRAARAAVIKQANQLQGLESRDRTLTEQVLNQRNQVAGLQAALMSRQISEEHARDSANRPAERAQRTAADPRGEGGRRGRRGGSSRCRPRRGRRVRRRRRRAGPVGTPSSPGGLAIDSGGMVQAAAGSAGRRRAGDRRRQCDRDAPLHLGRRPRVLPGGRLRLLRVGQLRPGGRRTAELTARLDRLRELGRAGAGAAGSRSTPTRARVDGGRGLALRHRRAGRERHPVVAGSAANTPGSSSAIRRACSTSFPGLGAFRRAREPGEPEPAGQDERQLRAGASCPRWTRSGLCLAGWARGALCIAGFHNHRVASSTIAGIATIATIARNQS